MKEKKPTCPLPPRNRAVLCLLNGGTYIVGTRRSPKTVHYELTQPHGDPIPGRWVKEWWDILPPRGSIGIARTRVDMLRLISHVMQSAILGPEVRTQL
jgi:hypothetical protein